MELLTRYVPGGKYTTAYSVELLPHSRPHRLPSVMAALMAAVSSVEPSPTAP